MSQQWFKQYAVKIILISIIGVTITLFFALDLQRYLTLEFLKSSGSEFSTYYEEHPVLVIGIYMLIYIVMAAFSFPGATIMTLAAGAMFGLLVGTIVVSFASTIGATCAMLIARTLLRDYVQTKFKEQIRVINEGIKKDGGYYLFTLRLVPAVPFFVINLGMGLTPISAFTFYWVSQVGMLAGTIVYVNAGSELGKLQSLSGILSPTLIISFVLLGVFPLIVKKLVNAVEQRRQTQPEKLS